MLLAVTILIATQAPKPILIDNVRVVDRPGHVIEQADVLIKNGTIAEIAPSLAVDGADKMDGSGLTLYAGFIHPMARIVVEGVAPTPPAQGTPVNQAARDADPFGLATNLLVGKKLADAKQASVSEFGDLATNGYGVAHVAMDSGVIGPQTACFSLVSPEIGPGTLFGPSLGVTVTFQTRGFTGYPSSTMGAIAIARQAFADGGWYGRRVRRYEANPGAVERVPFDPNLDPLSRVASGAQYAIFNNLNESSGLQALAIAKEFGLRPILNFDRGAGAIVDVLGRATVLLEGTVPAKPSIGEDLAQASLTSTRAYFNELAVGAELDRRGIDFCYAPDNESNPLEGIRTYVRAGLSRDAALAAMTTRPAKLLGLEGRVGTVERGKMANLVLMQGDLFDSSSQTMAVWVEGRRVAFGMPTKKDVAELKADPPLKAMAPNYSSYPHPAETTPAFRLYRNATIWTQGRAGKLSNADLLVRDGKIVAVGAGLNAPAGCEIVDASGKHISPGIWDAHSHTAILGNVNEGTNMVTVECRIGDVVNHRDTNVYRQLAGGTIGGQQLHGSANAIGGQTCVSKWRWGLRPADYPVQGAPGGVKFALGENPIREDSGGFGQQQQPVGSTLLTFRPRTRMGVEEAIRRSLTLGSEYAQKWDDYRTGKSTVEPRRDLQLEGLAEIATGKRYIHSHGYRQDEFLTLMRVAQAQGAKIATFQHILEGYKIADEMADAGIGGSSFVDWWGYKLEAYDAIPESPSLMAARGVLVSLNSDSNNQARRLQQEAAKVVRYGGTAPEAALAMVTINPAKQLGIDRWTGSLEPGKDADFVVWSGDPLSIETICLETHVDGVKRFDRTDDLKQRTEREAELKEARRLLNPDFRPAEKAAAGKEEAKAAPSFPQQTSAAGSKRYARVPVLIAGATVHPMKGEPFKGDVLIGSDGKIAAVGRVSAPRGATRVDGRGKHLYPGLIDANTTLGLVEIDQVAVSVDTSERGGFHPDYRVSRAIFPDSEAFPVARAQGVLTAISRPSGGSGILGQAALIHTDGYTWEDLSIDADFALNVSAGGGGAGFGHDHDDDDDRCRCEDWWDENLRAGAAQPGRGEQPEDAEPGLRDLTAQLNNAKEYRAARGKGERAFDARYEAMLEVVDGKLPVLLGLNSAASIRSAVAWSEREKVPVLIFGASGAGEIADWLAARNVPLILGSIFNVPGGENPYDLNYTLPARLQKAGVKFCLSTGSARDVRWLRDLAGFASANGMTGEDAMRSITLWPAEMLGMGSRLGAIATGYEGTLILCDGPLPEAATRVLQAWVGGRPVSFESRQTRLYDKYRQRPK